MHNKLIKIKYVITYFKYNYWDFRQQNQLNKLFWKKLNKLMTK